ncbi:hypothetical protein FHE73_13705 [Bacillus thuringiensis]|nr:hypothetical protein CGQ22_13370 [Bacillus sp. M13(2017)]QCY61770.1 hypothetical protein FHE73_13705 [Bacillus thuringiensis]
MLFCVARSFILCSIYESEFCTIEYFQCSLKCVLYLHQNRLKFRWFSWRKKAYSIFAAILFI